MLTLFGWLLMVLGAVFLLFLMVLFFGCFPLVLVFLIIAGPLAILILLLGGGWGNAFLALIGGAFGMFIWLCIDEGGLPFRIKRQEGGSMIVFFLAIGFIVLSILDVRTTTKVLELGGYEANPIARLLMRWHLFIPVKTIATTVVALIILFSNSNAAIHLGLFSCILYSLIVMNNLWAIRQARKQYEEEGIR